MGQGRSQKGWIFGALGFLLGAGLVMGWNPSEVVANPTLSRSENAFLEAGDEVAMGDIVEISRPYAVENMPSREPISASAADGTSSSLFSSELLAYAGSGLSEGWQIEREDEMPEAEVERGLERFTDQVRGLPRSIGRRLAHNATKLEEAIEIGPAFELLQRIENGEQGPMLALVRDAGKFARLFDRTTGQTIVNGVAHLRNAREAVEDGVILNYGPGVFRVRQLIRGRAPFPREVTLAGAGMDATMLYLDEIYSRDPLVNLAIENCTIYANGYITDMRGAPITLRMTRVRVIGFDTGAGASVALGLERAILDCRDCRFEGGYGRSPTSGNLLRSSADGFIARFERCLFSRMHVLRYGLSPTATMLFSDCAMRDVFDDPRAAAANHAGIELDNCQIVVAPRPDPRKRIERLDLNQLFPDWQERMIR